MPVGLFMYNSGGTMMYSVDSFQITVRGRGRPWRLSAQLDCSKILQGTLRTNDSASRERLSGG